MVCQCLFVLLATSVVHCYTVHHHFPRPDTIHTHGSTETLRVGCLAPFPTATKPSMRRGRHHNVSSRHPNSSSGGDECFFAKNTQHQPLVRKTLHLCCLNVAVEMNVTR